MQLLVYLSIKISVFKRTKKPRTEEPKKENQIRKKNTKKCQLGSFKRTSSHAPAGVSTSRNGGLKCVIKIAIAGEYIFEVAGEDTSHGGNYLYSFFFFVFFCFFSLILGFLLPYSLDLGILVLGSSHLIFTLNHEIR
jgi:hypothetical protein